MRTWAESRCNVIVCRLTAKYNNDVYISGNSYNTIVLCISPEMHDTIVLYFCLLISEI